MRKIDRWLIAGAGAAASLGLLAGASMSEIPTLVCKQSTAQQTAGRLASEIVAGRPVRVDCSPDLPKTENDGDVMGETSPISFISPLPVIHVAEFMCDDLQTYVEHRGNRKMSALKAGQALLVISHEAEHVNLQTGDELRVECTAVQVSATTSLYTSAQTADRLALRDGILKADARTVDGYHSADCYDGGKYDIDPQHAGGLFPNI